MKLFFYKDDKLYIKFFQKIFFITVIKLFFTIVYIRIISLGLKFDDHPLVEYPQFKIKKRVLENVIQSVLKIHKGLFMGHLVYLDRWIDSIPGGGERSSASLRASQEDKYGLSALGFHKHLYISQCLFKFKLRRVNLSLYGVELFKFELRRVIFLSLNRVE